MTAQSFINRAIKAHGRKYDYCKVVYVNNHSKVCIICPIHGKFWQEPHSHLRGAHCPMCKRNAKRTLDWFLQEARHVHGKRYDYSKFKYSGADHKSIIICPIHGEFWQAPHQHLQLGRGCPKCGGSNPLNTVEFIRRCQEINGSSFDYSEVVYKNMHTKVTITCNKCHKRFEQRPHAHIHLKQGCPHCSSTSSLKEKHFLDAVNVVVRQKFIKGIRGPVDGYDANTNTVYEFLGDYWHGNPLKYLSEDRNATNHRTFQELYDKTIEKFENLVDLGYTVVYIWETDWDKFRLTKVRRFDNETRTIFPQ